MLDFSDAPYQFFPSKPKSVVRWLTRQVNRKFVLPGANHRIEEIQVTGALDKVRDLRMQGSKFLLVPNHPTHSDPQLMTEVQRRLGISACFMAAYDVFLRSRAAALAMQWNGAFSIDREGSDRKAMGAAIDLLKQGRYGLTIFPEGNVYLTNDRVTPFLEGGAFIGLKAQRDLAGGRDEQTIYAVPVSLKYTHLTDVRPAVSDRLASIATAADTTLDREADPVAELIRVGHTLLEKNLRQRGALKSVDSVEGHQAKLEAAAEKIIVDLEEKIEMPPCKPRDGLIDRIRKIRSQIHAIRIDPDRSVDHRIASNWADDAILAFRIMTYATPYTKLNPSLDRYSETVEKLYEDLHFRWARPVGLRRAMVEIGEPIDLRERMESFSKKARNATVELNSDLETTVQTGVDRLSQSNTAIGAETFVC